MFIFLVITNNLHARELAPEELGQKSIMFNITSNEFGGHVIEDMLIPKNIDINTDINTTNDIAITSGEEEASPTTTAPEVEYNENTTTLTMGGLALTTTNDKLTPHTRTEVENYVVQPGDTVTSIAKQFGISINSILWSNNLSSYSIIRPGDTIKILPFSGIIHTVVSGDTLESIAKKYQSNTTEIVKTNNLDNDKLALGIDLLIPGGIRPTPKPVYKTPTVPAQTNTVITNVAPAKDSGTKLLWPAQSHRINQYYSWRHTGLDINGHIGDPIYASENGTVEVSGWNNGGYGYYIIINHSNGIKTLYAHNSQLLVSKGDTVSRGDVIAYIGSTGRSTGPHIHYEVRVNGSQVNPLLYTK